MAGSISSSNAIIMLQVADLFGTPVQIQGFSADDVFDSPDIEVAEHSMGVDGRLSAGFIFKETEMNITLQADSPSQEFFDEWYNAEQANRDKFVASGTVLLLGPGKKFTLIKGFLKRYKPMPDGKKTLEPRKFGIVWEQIIPAPVAG